MNNWKNCQVFNIIVDKLATTWHIGAFENWYTMKVLINNFREFDRRLLFYN